MNKTKVLAVASGKGGVGKTLTSVNIGIAAARKGLKVAVIDADPLSDIMAMLDQPLPQKSLPDFLNDPAAQTVSIAANFDIIFPQTKRSEAQASLLTHDLLKKKRQWLNERYALVIIDMPAGIGEGNPFEYLKFADALVLVTNPEPTAHVAAGNFIRVIQPLWQKKTIYLWHNKYEAKPTDRFDPDDVIGNYNANVPPQERITMPSLISTAYIPPDQALDLTKSDPPIIRNLYSSLASNLESLWESSMPSLPQSGMTGSRSASLINYFLKKVGSDDKPSAALAELEIFLAKQMNSTKPLPDKLRQNLLRWFDAAGRSTLRRQISKTREVVNRYLKEIESTENLFKPSAKTVSVKAVYREILPLLKSLSCLPPDSSMKRLSGLLLFRYTLILLFSNESALKLILGFLPRRTEAGTSIRDRRTQILRLIVRDTAWQKRYILLVKRLYPVVIRQRDHLITSFGLQDLLFLDEEGKVAARAYLQLFNETIYEMINSGMGIMAGFRFRPSSRAFGNAVKRLFQDLEQDRDN